MMRSNKIILVVAVISISVLCVSCNNIIPIKGSGNLKTSEITDDTFEKINSGGSAEIHFHASEEYRAVVTIDENIEEYVEIFTKNNVLNIRTKNGYNISPTKFTVDVYCPFLSGITMSGSGSFRNVGTIIVSTFETKLTGSGKVEATIECENYSAGITGSGKITVSGNINETKVSITGSGDFHGNELKTKSATITITGSGNANIYVAENLQAKITGSGNISYSGEPKVTSSVTGSGRIKKM
jgi:hypothetical protein